MREKQVQIPESLFGLITKLVLTYDSCSEEELWEQIREIQKGVYAKYDAMAKRDLYSTYKTNPDPVMRERARREYLQKAGIPDEFIWRENDPA